MSLCGTHACRISFPGECTGADAPIGTRNAHLKWGCLRSLRGKLAILWLCLSLTLDTLIWVGGGGSNSQCSLYCRARTHACMCACV